MAGTAALIFALALTLTSAGFVYLGITQIHAAFGWVQQADRALLQILTVEKSMAAAGSPASSRRGPANQRRDRVTAQNAVIATQADRLASLTSDNADQLRRALALRTALADRADAALHGTASPLGTVAAVRLRLLAMREAEFGLLAGRTERVERAIVVSLGLAVLTGLLALLLGLLGIGLLTSERLHRRHVVRDLIHLQRLDTIGMATTALAHEVNQPLTAATNYLAAVVRRLKGGGQDTAATLDVLKRIQEQIARAGKIIGRLRNFVEKPGSIDDRTLESPPAVIDDSIALLGTLDSRVRIATRMAPDLPLVSIDKVQLQQVLLNLIRNAVEALDGQGPCELLLSATAGGPGLILFEVSDNGPPLTKKAIGNMFKPFTSTKPNGMGVGLAICRGIIDAHGGRIWAAAGPTGGTVVRFTLPAAAEMRDAA